MNSFSHYYDSGTICVVAATSTDQILIYKRLPAGQVTRMNKQRRLNVIEMDGDQWVLLDTAQKQVVYLRRFCADLVSMVFKQKSIELFGQKPNKAVLTDKFGAAYADKVRSPIGSGDLHEAS